MNTRPIKWLNPKKTLVLLFPLVLILSVLSFNFKKSVKIFPNTLDLELTSYLDTSNSDKEGGTVIHIFDTTKNIIDLQYTIGSRNIYPYAGFQWIVKQGNPWMDISNYDHISFSVNPSNTEEVLIIILQFFTENFSKMDDRMTWRYMSKEFPLTKGQSNYSIPLKEFQTPLWWYNQYKKTEKEFSHADLSKLGMISIEEGSDAVGKTKCIILNSLSFEKKQSYNIAKLSLIFLILYYVIFFMVIRLMQTLQKRKDPVVIPYQKLFIQNDNTVDEQKIFKFLGNNFSNPVLSLSHISNELKIPGNKISFVIKEKFSLSFRQYLNTIRITEAKRLLQETKLQISQIGYKVGYSNLTHFCRTFKEVTGSSPNSFRQETAETQTKSTECVLNAEIVE